MSIGVVGWILFGLLLVVYFSFSRHMEVLAIVVEKETGSYCFRGMVVCFSSTPPITLWPLASPSYQTLP